MPPTSTATKPAKKCCRCQEMKDLIEYSKNRYKTDGHSAVCKVCESFYAKQWADRHPDYYFLKYHTDPEYRVKQSKHQGEWAIKNPDKLKAQQYLRSKIQTGKITRMPCEVCGKERSQAHHWSYLEENWLDVVWLCQFHHTLISTEGLEKILNAKIEEKYKLGLSRGKELQEPKQ